MTAPTTVARISSEHIGYHYDPAAAPALTVDPGTSVEFETLDARAGALYDRAVGTLFELPRPTAGKSNPITGPLAIRGARPGDALAVRIERHRRDEPRLGRWPRLRQPAVARPRAAGARADRGRPGRPGAVLRADRVPGCADARLRRRRGSIGQASRRRRPTPAPTDPIHCGYAGRNGGNMDQKVVQAGATLYLPVFVDDALLYIGDVHARQGDGELCGTAIEIGSVTRVRVDVVRGAGIRWPWLESADRWMVLVADKDFVVARREAVDAVVTLLERDLGIEPAEAMALLAVAGDLRIGQSMGGAIPMTLRLEIPKWEGVPGASGGVGLVIVDVHTHVMWYPDHVGGAVRAGGARVQARQAEVLRRRCVRGGLDLHSYDSTPDDHWKAAQQADKVVVFGLQAKGDRRLGAERAHRGLRRAAPRQAHRLGVGRPRRAGRASTSCDHAVNDAGLTGLKLGPAYQHFDPTDRTHWPFFAAVEKLRHPDHLAPGHDLPVARPPALGHPALARGPRDGLPGDAHDRRPPRAPVGGGHGRARPQGAERVRGHHGRATTGRGATGRRWSPPWSTA